MLAVLMSELSEAAHPLSILMVFTQEGSGWVGLAFVCIRVLHGTSLEC